jgi:hypothetical protein
MLSLPLPVGRHPLLGDPWSPSPGLGAYATKWRIVPVVPECSPPLHFMTVGRRELAAVSSMLWFRDSWQTCRAEQAVVRDMVERLARLGVQVVSCHGQHHAIVFRDTPDALSARLRADDRIAAAMSAGTRGDALQRWRDSYVRNFPRRVFV